MFRIRLTARLTARLAAALACLPLLCTSARGQETSLYVIPSWGDMAIVYGPGTAAAMDSPGAIEAMVRHWQGRGFTGVFLRSDLGQFPPGAIVRNSARRQDNPGLARSWQLIDEIMATADLHRATSVAARKTGFEYWIFHPHLFSEGAPEEVGVPGLGRMVPWSYELRYLRDHPEAIVVDRAGAKQWMVPEYIDPGIRAHKAAEFAHMAKTYRPTGILASLRSETNQLIPPPDHADQYGFGPQIVAEMRRLYGVDILSDARFDWRAPGFNPQDEMLGRWRDLRGAGFTELLREIRAAMRAAAPGVKLGITLSGDFMGPPLGNARLDWATWIDEGLVDLIVAGASQEATYDTRADKKGYLTHARAGKGTIPLEQLKERIRRSAHPDIQVIQPGAPAYFFPPPPVGADGWQCDAWYDSYHKAAAERWSQWQRDLAERGAIDFLSQNFDAFAPGDSAALGGLGDGRYHPDLRACPGFWYTVTDGADGRPFIQNTTRRGTTGCAITLTRRDLTAVHYSSPDRSLMTGQLDTAITTGKATLSFWIHRPEGKNTLTVFLTGNAAYEKDVALRVDGAGAIFHSRGAEWIATPIRIPAGQWTRLTLDADLESMTYAARMGQGAGVEICRNVGFAAGADRSIAQHGVESVKVKVPAWRLFNTLIFLPAEDGREPFHLDDVSLQWRPAQPGAPQGKDRRLSEDFENEKPGASEFPGRSWQIEPGGPAPNTGPAFFIERSTSFGAGTRCLRAAGGGRFTAPLGSLPLNGPLTIDFDLFVRSGKASPILLPDPAVRSPHSVTFSVQATDGALIARVAAVDGSWRLWDGTQFIDTGRAVTLDGWGHVQLVLEQEMRTLRLITQPVGEAPRPVAEVPLLSRSEGPLRLIIEPSATPRHVSGLDNLEITAP